MNKPWAVTLAAPLCLLALTACEGGLASKPVAGVCDYAPKNKPSAKIGLNGAQKNNATIIIRKGAEMKMPKDAVEVAITAALQESALKNGRVGDRNLNGPAYGLFQMRPVINGKSSGWGTLSEVTNPDYAAGKFYRVLRDVDGWEYMSHAAAAQAVEKSADGSLYADDVRKAKKIVARIAWELCRKA